MYSGFKFNGNVRGNKYFGLTMVPDCHKKSYRVWPALQGTLRIHTVANKLRVANSCCGGKDVWVCSYLRGVSSGRWYFRFIFASIIPGDIGDTCCSGCCRGRGVGRSMGGGVYRLQKYLTTNRNWERNNRKIQHVPHIFRNMWLLCQTQCCGSTYVVCIWIRSLKLSPI